MPLPVGLRWRNWGDRQDSNPHRPGHNRACYRYTTVTIWRRGEVSIPNPFEAASLSKRARRPDRFPLQVRRFHRRIVDYSVVKEPRTGGSPGSRTPNSRVQTGRFPITTSDPWRKVEDSNPSRDDRTAFETGRGPTRVHLPFFLSCLPVSSPSWRGPSSPVVSSNAGSCVQPSRSPSSVSILSLPWRRAEESNPYRIRHLPAFKTGCGPPTAPSDSLTVRVPCVLPHGLRRVTHTRSRASAPP